jgi:uroporphyrinogen decarboxylase
MTWNNRENVLRAIRMDGPSSMPYNIHITKSAWLAHGEAIKEVILKHPGTWPNPDQVIWDWKTAKLDKTEDPSVVYEDCWGCLWRTSQPGIIGCVTKSVLSDYANYDNIKWPDSANYNGGITPVDWQDVKCQVESCRADGQIARGGLNHGYYLLRLEYLRGFENLMMDMVDDREDFRDLVKIVQKLNRAAVENWIRAGVDIIDLPEDLGTQTSSVLGPVLFEKWSKRHYIELHRMIQDAGLISRFHTDGNIMDIADKMLEIRPDMLNLQDRVNGIENIAAKFKGRLCIDLDIDRQNLLPYGTAEDIYDAIEYYIKTLGSPDGGLMMTIGIYADVPPCNLEALVSVLEELNTYWY